MAKQLFHDQRRDTPLFSSERREGVPERVLPTSASRRVFAVTNESRRSAIDTDTTSWRADGVGGSNSFPSRA